MNDWPDSVIDKYTIQWNWLIPENEIIEKDRRMYMHPYTLFIFMHETYGLDNAIELFKSIQRNSVDAIFNANRPTA